MALIKRFWFPTLVVLLSAGLLLMIVWNLWWGTTRLPVAGRMPQFSMTTESNQPMALSTLDGKIKLVTFIFTNCGDTCPMTLMSYMKIQDELKKEGLFGKDVHLVAITMDPEFDTEQRLTEYSKHFQADLSGWHFLRGSKEETASVMKELNIPPDLMENGQYMHSNRVFLVDDHRNIRKNYDLTTMESTDEILADMKNLVDEIE